MSSVYNGSVPNDFSALYYSDLDFSSSLCFPASINDMCYVTPPTPLPSPPFFPLVTVVHISGLGPGWLEKLRAFPFLLRALVFSILGCFMCILWFGSRDPQLHDSVPDVSLLLFHDV